MKKALLIYTLIFPFAVLSQSTIKSWVKDVRITVSDADQNRLKGVSVKFTVSNKSYYAKYVEKNNNYRFDSLPELKGKLRIDLKGYDGQNREILPISNGHRLSNWSWQYIFTLGKAGCSYTLRDNRLIPFTDFPGYFGLKYQRNKLDSVLQFLKINNFTIYQHFKKNATMIISFEQGNNAQKLKILTKNAHILEAGRPYGQNHISGFFHNSFSINFNQQLDDKMITKNDRELLLEKYNLEIDHLYSPHSYSVKIKGNHSEINILMIKLRNEPIVKMINSSIHEFESPKVD